MTCLIGKDLFGYGAGLAALAAGLLAGASAQAAVVISSAATSGINCSGGVCVPTAKNAVLNTNDLENLLASGNVEVTTTGSGVQAQDIVVKSALSWSGTGALSLDAYRSITVNQAVAVEGQSGLTLTTNDGGKNGELSFGKKGNVTFANLSSSLTINGASYTFESSVKDLAGAIASNPNGNYALPTAYNAKADGSYTAAPISTTFTGTFEALGNAVSNLTIKDSSKGMTPIGLFQELGKGGTIRDLGLAKVFVTVHKTFHGQQFKPAGALIGSSYGTVLGSWASGTVKTGAASAGDVLGGLIGYNQSTGTISHSHATTSVLNGQDSGGLLGINDGTVEYSYATGQVTGDAAGGLVYLNGYRAPGQITQSFAAGAVSGAGAAGGLVENNDGPINDSYATGSVTGGAFASAVGGLVSYNSATISRSYSTGGITSQNEDTYLGGLIGYDGSASGSITSAYWDTETSGITNPDQGAGNVENDPGIIGLTTDQFQSGLPDGFDPSIWNERSSVNDGFPYLIEDPPP